MILLWIAALTAAQPSERSLGVHLGLNATAAVDVKFAHLLYAEAATQLTGLGALAAPRQGFVVSLFLLAGVTLPIVDREDVALSFEVGPHAAFLYSYPLHIMSGGVAAGLRLIHRSGFTFAFKLPLVGYAGSVDQPRGGLLYYYVAAVASMPLITFGYSF